MPKLSKIPRCSSTSVKNAGLESAVDLFQRFQIMMEIGYNARSGEYGDEQGVIDPVKVMTPFRVQCGQF